MTLSKHIRIVIALAVLGLPVSIYADSVTTVPVGYTTITIPAGATQAISIPLDNLPDYQGVIAQLSGTVISVSGVTWTATAFGPYASKPYVLRFLSGTSKGRQVRVASNTSSSLSVVLPNGVADISAMANVGDTFELLALDTLASFFGTGSGAAVQANPDPSQADNVLVRTLLSWVTYYNDGSKWLRVAGTGSSQDNIALSSENGVLFVRRGNTDLILGVSGQVPTTNLITDLAGSGNTFFANRFPVDSSLALMGLQNLPNWMSSTNSDAADAVWLRTSLSWVGYYYDGTNWLRIAGTASPQNPTLKVGSAFLIDRRGTQDVICNQTLPYSL